MAILACRGQPDLAIHNHGRGPAEVRNGRFPGDAFRFTPLEWQVNRMRVGGSRGVAIGVRAAKFGPVGMRDRIERHREKQDDGKDRCGTHSSSVVSAFTASQPVRTPLHRLQRPGDWK